MSNSDPSTLAKTATPRGVFDPSRYQAALRASNLSRSARLVAYVLSNHASAADQKDDAGNVVVRAGEAYPGVDVIEAESGIGWRTVMRTLNELEIGGWIRRERGRGQASRTHIFLQVPAKTATIAA